MPAFNQPLANLARRCTERASSVYFMARSPPRCAAGVFRRWLGRLRSITKDFTHGLPSFQLSGAGFGLALIFESLKRILYQFGQQHSGKDSASSG